MLTSAAVPNAGPITAVVFDLYETLVTESGVDVPRAGALGPAFGLDPIAYRKRWKPLRPRVICGELTFTQAITIVGKELGVEIGGEHIKRAVDERTRARTAVLERADPGLMLLTQELARRGVRLATISNCMAEDVDGWPRSPFAPHVACTLFSWAVGLAKPDPQIYLAATRQLGVMPDEALYVGDGGDDELRGATEAGLRVAQAGWFVKRDRSADVPFLASPQDVMQIVFPRETRGHDLRRIVPT